MLDWWTAAWDWLGANAGAVGALAAILTVVAYLMGWIGNLWRGLRRLFGGAPSPSAPRAPAQPPATAQTISGAQHGNQNNIVANHGVVHQGLTMEQHERNVRTRLQEQKDLLERAHGAELRLAQSKIEELERQLANPEASFAEMKAKIADLEARLDRDANAIGSERIDAAKAAMAEGDFSLADDIFEEIEAANELHVEQSARAAFGRGEVAEAEIRWADAAAHYARAARIAPDFDRLFKAREFAWRAGDFPAAHRLGEDLLALAREAGDQRQLATALNEHALTLQAQGRASEAEALYREALEIDRATIGEAHPDYAIHLNNLAYAVEAQGRASEAEMLYREALEVDRATIGEAHPDYAACLNNLAGAVEAQGRASEAEALFREALEIDRATIGEAHPDYATDLNNLAGAVKARGRASEAEALYREALEIDQATIGEAHPDYAIHLNNLAGAVWAQGRASEAEALFREALEIDRATIGEAHPDYATDLNNLALLLRDEGRAEEARPLWEQALAILEAALPPNHPHIAAIRQALASLP